MQLAAHVVIGHLMSALNIKLTISFMYSSANVVIVRSNIDVLVKEGLGPRADGDFLLVRDACLVLAKLSGEDKERGKLAKDPFRLPKDHEIFTRLSHLLVEGRLSHANGL